MSNVIGNSERIKFLKGQAAQAAGNYFARLGRHEIAREEYQQAFTAYNSVQQTFPEFVEAQNQKNTVLAMLNQLVGTLLVLGQWLQNEFDKATATGWLPPTDILGADALKLAMRTPAVKRAKSVNLGTDKVALVIGLNELSENQEIQVIMRVYPLGEQNYLPANLKFTVLPKIGAPHVYSVDTHNPGFETEWFYKRGEQFSIQIQLNNVTVTEHFVV